MNNSDKKKRIIIISIILVFIGIAIPFICGFTKDLVNITSSWDFIKLVCQNSFVLSISLFCLVIGICMWINYALNYLSKPYDDIVYLLEKKGNKYTFIDKDGNVLEKTSEEYIAKDYYEVSRTKNIVHEIKNSSKDEFDMPYIKTSYWKFICLIFGSYDGHIILPFIWFCLLQAIARLVLVDLMSKLVYLGLCLVLIFILVYDKCYKLKKKRDKKYVDDEDDRKLKTMMIVLKCTISFVVFGLFVFLNVVAMFYFNWIDITLLTLLVIVFFTFDVKQCYSLLFGKDEEETVEQDESEEKIDDVKKSSK